MLLMYRIRLFIIYVILAILNLSYPVFCAVFFPVFFFFNEKTAYDRRISDWSSDVCSSDLFLIQPVPGRRSPLFEKIEGHADRGLHRIVVAGNDIEDANAAEAIERTLAEGDAARRDLMGRDGAAGNRGGELLIRRDEYILTAFAASPPVEIGGIDDASRCAGIPLGLLASPS